MSDKNIGSISSKTEMSLIVFQTDLCDQRNPIRVAVSFVFIVTHLNGTAKDLKVGGQPLKGLAANEDA